MSSPLKQIHLAGKGYELGLAHGKALKSEIHEMLGILHRILRNPKQSIQQGLLQYGHQHVMGTIRYQRLVKAAHRLLPMIAREYIDEMKGIAMGSGVRFSDILVINTYDDLLYLAGCSSVCSKTSDGKILHGRNLDYYYADLLGKDCLFVYEDLGIMSMGFPGYCGCLTATNRSGMTLSAHTSVCHDPARGMPTGLLYRTIMQYTSTLQQAKDCLTHLPKTVGNNVMISSAHEGSACIAEIHPQQVAFRDQEEIRDVRWTTNHYRMPEMLQYQKKASIGSLTRHRSIRQSVLSAHPETIDDLKSICSHYDGNVEGWTSVANCGTIQSVIVDAQAGSMYIARHDTAPVTQGGYQQVKLEWK